jgi:hypothetical protein
MTTGESVEDRMTRAVLMRLFEWCVLEIEKLGEQRDDLLVQVSDLRAESR